MLLKCYTRTAIITQSPNQRHLPPIVIPSAAEGSIKTTRQADSNKNVSRASRPRLLTHPAKQTQTFDTCALGIRCSIFDIHYSMLFPHFQHSTLYPLSPPPTPHISRKLTNIWTEHPTGFSGGTQKKMKMRNCHCEGAVGDCGNLLPLKTQNSLFRPPTKARFNQTMFFLPILGVSLK